MMMSIAVGWLALVICVEAASNIYLTTQNLEFVLMLVWFSWCLN